MNDILDIETTYKNLSYRVSPDSGRMQDILFLDDRSKRLHSALMKFRDSVILVPTAKEAIKLLSTYKYLNLVYLDHDLCFEEFVDSDREDCGMEVVRYLVKNKKELHHLDGVRFIIHSSNEVGSLKMFNAMESAGYNVGKERWTYE